MCPLRAIFFLILYFHEKCRMNRVHWVSAKAPSVHTFFFFWIFLYEQTKIFPRFNFIKIMLSALYFVRIILHNIQFCYSVFIRKIRRKRFIYTIWRCSWPSASQHEEWNWWQEFDFRLRTVVFTFDLGLSERHAFTFEQ